MEIETTSIEGLFILRSPFLKDNRGEFRKLFHSDEFRINGLSTDFKELYYSISQKDVVRGMHFQSPPMEHDKLVYVSSGVVLDVVLDIRKHSSTYGEYYSIELSEDQQTYLYISKGLAHGFRSLRDGTIVHYAQNSCYSKENDCGIAFDSFGFNWGIENPIISQRDGTFSPFSAYNSPF